MIEVVRKERVTIIRFTNPKERNALSVAVLIKLHEILDNLDSQTESIIFTGSEDVFASGANLREIAALKNETDVREFALCGHNLMRKIADNKRSTVAAINGFCFGGALDLALSCKTRIATPNASFSHPGANLGIITGWSGTQRLPRLIGESKASEMFFTAKRVDAPEALRIGLIDEICDVDVLERAITLCTSQKITL